MRDGCRYFDVTSAEPSQKWRKKWFYVLVDQNLLLAFFTASPEMLESWDHVLSTTEEEEASSLMFRVQEMRRAVTGIQLVSTYVYRRVCPLRQRAHPLWRYEGCLDVTRMSPIELSGHGFHGCVKHITGISPVDIASFDFSVFSYGLGTPIPEVF